VLECITYYTAISRAIYHVSRQSARFCYILLGLLIELTIRITSGNTYCYYNSIRVVTDLINA